MSKSDIKKSHENEKSGLKIWSNGKMCVLLHPHFDQRVGAKLKNDRDLAQLVAHTSGGREVAGSSPVIPTGERELKTNRLQLLSLCPETYSISLE